MHFPHVSDFPPTGGISENVFNIYIEEMIEFPPIFAVLVGLHFPLFQEISLFPLLLQISP